MTKETKQIVLNALTNARGDDYYRAKRAFNGYTKKRMQTLYGQSGETCQAILDDYKRYHDRITAAIKEIKKL